MAEIILNPSNNPNISFDGRSSARDVQVGHTSVPKYVGARAVVTRDGNKVRIWLKDYKGETEEVIAEAIQSITTNDDGSLTFTLPDGRTITTGSLKGDKGDTGDTGAVGNGIASIEKTSTSGLADTYTITYTDGDTDTFIVTNGKDGIDGTDGADGADGQDGQDGHSPVVTASKSGKVTTVYVDGTSIATINDGNDGQDGIVQDVTANGTSILDGNTAKIVNFTGTDGNTNGTAGLVPAPTTSDADKYLKSDGTWGEGGVGTITDVEVNGTSVVTSGVAEVTVPTKTGDLTNNSGFITSPNVVYATCSTAGGTAAKVATIESGSLTSLNEGDQAIVKFTNANSVASPTLQIGTTTAKSIKRYGTTAPSTSASTSWNAGSCVYFVYDGTYWQQIGFLNTTYSEISTANITNATGSSTGLVTGRRAKSAVEAFAPVKDVTVDGTSVLSSGTAVVDLSGKANASHTHTKSQITDFPTLAAVATTGNYSSLVDKPTIPTDTGDLTNGAGYITGVTSTSTPTASTISEFDASSHINSADMSAQDVSDFVDGLDANKQEAPNDLGSFVNLASYTSSNMYTCTSDGYVFVYGGSNTAYAAICGSTNDTNVIALGVGSGRDSVYVRKGMRAYTVGSPSAVRFFPLV